MAERSAVGVAAAGAAWETEALERLARGGPAVALHKRCVDLPDLLATAATGLGGVVVVSASLPGLDADSLDALRRAGVGVVLVADDPAHDNALGRLGPHRVVPPADLATLGDLVRAAATTTGEAVAAAEPRTGGAGTPSAGPGRVLAVWGPAGAPGRTTVAVGVATELAARDLPTLLIDADPYAGAVAQLLGVLDDASGLLAAARLGNGGRLDPARLATLARRVGQLRVLSGLPRADRWAEVRPAAFEEVLDAAVALAEHVVVDVGFSLEREPGDPFSPTTPQRNQMTLATLARADEVLVVGAADPVGLARLARGLVEVRDLVPDTPLRVVVNRARASLGWGEREVRGMVEGFVTPLAVHFLPDDRRAVDRALMAGAGVREVGDSELAAALADLTAALLGGPARRPARGLLQRLPVRRRRAGRAR